MKVKFKLPPRSVLEMGEINEKQRYAIHNYFGMGPIARIKRRRFQIALNFAQGTYGKNAIDMGTCDGVFIPTLSAHYRSVTAIDYSPEYVKRSTTLVNALKLANVGVTCNRDLSFDQLRAKIGHDFDVMFLMETLEHVGSQPDIWGSKISFLDGCFTLLKPGASIIVSVPIMVGPVVVFKNLLQRALRIGHDPMTFRHLLQSGLYNTTELEPLWNGHHVGFNHLKLEKHLKKHFTIARRKQTAISVFYVLKQL